MGAGAALWAWLVRPGSCLTLFTPKARGSSAGLAVRWEWTDCDGLDGGGAVDGLEVGEAWRSALDIADAAGIAAPRGLRIHPEDARDARQRGARLVGGSLGLAFLLSRVRAAQGRPWPDRAVAWGLLSPCRDGSYTIGAVDDETGKATLAASLGATYAIRGPGSALDIPTLMAPATEQDLVAWLAGLP